MLVPRSAFLLFFRYSSPLAQNVRWGWGQVTYINTHLRRWGTFKYFKRVKWKHQCISFIRETKTWWLTDSFSRFVGEIKWRWHTDDTTKHCYGPTETHGWLKLCQTFESKNKHIIFTHCYHCLYSFVTRTDESISPSSLCKRQHVLFWPSVHSICVCHECLRHTAVILKIVKWNEFFDFSKWVEWHRQYDEMGVASTNFIILTKAQTFFSQPNCMDYRYDSLLPTTSRGANFGHAPEQRSGAGLWVRGHATRR